VRRLRIAHVLPSFQIGGQERVALDLSRTFRAGGHHVLAFSLEPMQEGDLGGEFRAAGVETRTVRQGPGADPTLVVRLAAQFTRERVDVVHTHNPPALIYGAPAAKLARAVVVHTKHGENLEVHARRVVLRRLMARFADAFVAVSPMTEAAARSSRDVHARKLRTIPNGIDVARFGPDEGARRAVRRELGIPDGAWVIGTVGRLASEKNHVLLVRALAGALDDRTRLVIVGDGAEAGAIARAADEAGATPWLHLTGARADVPRLLRAFDVFALPSTSEGLPLVILEAMATGLPVVASAVGGLPDVIADGDTGLLIPTGDAAALRGRLLGLASDRERARRLGARAREAALSAHSLERMSADYLRLYEELLSRDGKLAARARSATSA
jgi:glycosyltransferase involved in cell wall biosynthesis